MMVARLLYYKKIMKTLKSTVFKINPYDTCVENYKLNNKYQIICIHLVSCKLSHQDSKVNEEFMNTLCDEY